MIALFVFDDIIRPFGGDDIVVLVVWSFFRIFIPEKIRLPPLFVEFRRQNGGLLRACKGCLEKRPVQP